jgi:hypothetical protein
MNIKYILPVVALFIFYGCHKNQIQDGTGKEILEKKKIEKPKYGKVFFDYDQIDYYGIDIEEDKLQELDDNRDHSKADQYKYDVLIDETPTTLQDLDFLNYLTAVGFSKKEIPSTEFDKINTIFVEKNITDGYIMGCIPFFRDILVFKKKNKVIGIAKICFNCHQYRIIGTNADTKNFGMGDDYEKLGAILDLLKKNKSEH